MYGRTTNRTRGGYTLVELLMVVAVVGIVAGMALTDSSPSTTNQLHGAGQMLMARLDYARNLAVSNGSQYLCTFNLTQNRFLLEHSGSNSALDVLPVMPFDGGSDPTVNVLDIDELPTMADMHVRLHKVQLVGGTATSTSTIEFGPLGATTASRVSEIWLAAGEGSRRRFLPIQVDPITGLAWLGNIQSAVP